MKPSDPSVQFEGLGGLARFRVRLSGSVQGVGLRPAVFRAATAHGLVGWIANVEDGVVLEVEGKKAQVEALLAKLDDFASPIAVHRIEAQPIALVGEAAFEIRTSSTGSLNAFQVLSADLGTCEACLAEVRQPTERRFGYPFTSCAQCGPRYSITIDLPFDRERTALSSFELCSECKRQYESPSDRRFHAQTIACPKCGPLLEFSIAEQRVETGVRALAAAAESILQGKIIAVLGIGGFQLLADATNPDAISTLRERKHRPAKPLAVMFTDESQLQSVCVVDEVEASVLRSPAKPIVLVARKPGEPRAWAPCEAVAFASNRIGAMLPTSALHALLCDRVARPIVCTSGNLTDEPLSHSREAAKSELAGIADGILLHDRAVVRPLDDSVVQCVGNDVQLLRRARGYVPATVARIPSGRTVLALGGHQKSTFALGVNAELQLSPHFGDLQSLASRERLRREVDAWLKLTRAKPELIACDLHPRYASTLLAEQLAAEYGAELVRVQHHHAHVAAVLAEHGRQTSTLGLAWDGAGYGPDQTLWGGEVLLCEGYRYQRVAQLLPFALPGAALAQREPRRALLGALHVAGLWSHAQRLTDFDEHELATLQRALERGVQAPLTSSMGRLFDVVAALLGLCSANRFEGQAAELLMQVALGASSQLGAYDSIVVEQSGAIDWRPLLHEMVAERERGVASESVARRFHETLVRLGVELAERYSDGTVALSGGCFQNRLLLGRLLTELRRHGLTPLTSWCVPVNDGGLAVGQAWIAAQASLTVQTPMVR
ncbi:MAG TPA: carbamoyltransferase HypF [Polyangiaceae bacterium]|nr:carbamoyltransferase HypF [Polyangiaceae bacterium]